MIQGTEWIIILVLALIVLGPSKLPGLARSVGKALTEVKSMIRSGQEEIQNLAKEADIRRLDTPPPPKPSGLPEEKRPDEPGELNSTDKSESGK